MKLFFAICFTSSIFCFSQEVENDTVQETQRITFSTIQNTKQKSLEPYYQELKKAAFGVQRFSLFEQLAEAYIKKGDTDSILKYSNLYEKEIANWDKPEEEKHRHYAKAHYFMAIGNVFNGLLEKSTEWHIKGIQEAEKAKFSAYEYRNKIGLANTYLLKEKPARTIEIITEAIAQFSANYSELTNRALLVLADAHICQEEFSKADKHIAAAIKIAQSFDDLEMELNASLTQAKLYEAKGEYGKAFQGYETTRNRALEAGYTAIYFEGSLLLAKRYFKEEMYDTANIALSFAYINAIDKGNLQFQKEVLEMEARSYAKQGDYKNGYAVITQLFYVLNQMSEQQQRAIVKELEVQYETLEKEKEIVELEEGKTKREAELKRQKTIKNAFLIGFLVILIPIMALLYVYYQKIQAQSELTQKRKEINEQKVTTLKQEQELDLIKAAIEGQDDERKRIAQELHDSIGGNLAGIKLQLSSITKGAKKYETISTQIDETYQLVRDISHTLVPKKFKQNAFTEVIETYIKSISEAGKIQISFHPHPEKEINTIEEKLQMELFKIIQELMTNTIKHAKAKNVDIHLSRIENELSLLFEDNGNGFEVNSSKAGIGFENIKNRVSKLSGNLNIDSVLKRGTVVSIEIPLKKINHEL